MRKQNKLKKAIKRLTATIDDQRGEVTPAQAMAYTEHVLTEQGYTNIQVQQPVARKEHNYSAAIPSVLLYQINELTINWLVSFTCDCPAGDSVEALSSSMHVWEVPQDQALYSEFSGVYGEW
tara:strand:- start:212 stop:577 length:366 start_codon:yes stop_codon:yes gene_type:complete